MKKKRLLWLFVFIISITSCSTDQSYFNDDVDLEPDHSNTLKVLQHSNYRTLGWGIDLKSDYLSLQATTFPVIDIEKFEKEHNSQIASSIGRYTQPLEYYGSNAIEYIKDVEKNLNIGANVKEGEKEWFSGTITNNFKSKQKYSANYSFAGRDHITKVADIYIINDVELLKKYLDQDFINAVNTKSASYIIENYGTHVLTNITVGGKLSLLYRSEVINTYEETTKSKTTKAGLTIAYGGFDFNGNGSSTTTEDVKLNLNNTNAYLYARSTGGTSSVNVALDYTTGKLLDYRESVAAWDKSIDLPNSVVVKVNKAIPIYEFVTDANKKNALKIAYDNRFKEDKIDLVYPIYELWKSQQNNNFYTIDYSDVLLFTKTHGYTLEKIQGYAYKEQKAGTVPLYKLYHPSFVNSYYTISNTQRDLFRLQYGYSYEGIAFYVYDKQVVNTVPFYEMWNNSIKNNYYTTNPNDISLFKSYGYTLEGTQGYVISK